MHGSSESMKLDEVMGNRNIIAGMKSILIKYNKSVQLSNVTIAKHNKETWGQYMEGGLTRAAAMEKHKPEIRVASGKPNKRWVGQSVNANEIDNIKQ